MSEKLTHIDKSGSAQMVDVGEKAIQKRIAVAEGFIKLCKDTLQLIQENNIKKGDVLATARIAGIQAAKQTPTLIPLCHTLLLNQVTVDFNILENGIKVTSQTKCNGKTGVEMEALTAVNIACLTIYDMCKAVDNSMEITDVRLLKKEKI
ncbi:cyclic pyranopterin monophosphate synthase MoaC [Saccharicrinis aurantiacus]|uniref:cyclic pyranopterin monophosphate synthase MoaC n=1 Tax=Saccharicrinis aurantiacus TaxID=1849719 RepID=UPI00094F752D|nr:cyclic pyranopterin monophosphate synthase MoaC [Saccharicrinis aurantiacus]